MAAPNTILGTDTVKAALLTKSKGNFDDIYAKTLDLILAKGDVLVATGAATLARLAIGTDGFILVADSGEACGIKWASETKSGGLCSFESDETVEIGNGTVPLPIPAHMNGWNLTDVTVTVITAGTVGATTDVQIRRVRAGASADMLTTKVTLDAAQYTVSDGVIDAANDDVNTGDALFVDIDALNTNAPIGLSTIMSFQKP